MQPQRQGGEVVRKQADALHAAVHQRARRAEGAAQALQGPLPHEREYGPLQLGVQPLEELPDGRCGRFHHARSVVRGRARCCELGEARVAVGRGGLLCLRLRPPAAPAHVGGRWSGGGACPSAPPTACTPHCLHCQQEGNRLTSPPLRIFATAIRHQVFYSPQKKKSWGLRPQTPGKLQPTATASPWCARAPLQQRLQHTQPHCSSACSIHSHRIGTAHN